MSKRKLALFGGSFNPPHIGHTLAITYVLSQHDVSGALVVPAYKHAFGKDLVDYGHRMNMAKLAFEWLPNVTVTNVEETIGHSRTLDTVRFLEQRFWNAQFRVVIGTDILDEVHKWHKWDEIAKMASPIVLGRAGYPAEDIDNYLPEVSSHHVRWLLKQPDVLPNGQLRDHAAAAVLHPQVQEYIHEHGLYEGNM